MNSNGWIKDLLAEELRYRTTAGDRAIEQVIDGFMTRLDSSRRTIVPTYLTDSMFEAMRKTLPFLEYKEANEIYKAALTDYHSNLTRAKDDEEPGAFW